MGSTRRLAGAHDRDAQGKVIARQSGEMPIERFQALIAEASASGSAATGTTAPTGTAAPAT